MNYPGQFIDCGFLRQSPLMLSLSWLPLALQRNLEKSVIPRALAMTTSMLVSRVVNTVTPSFSSISSPIPSTARLSRANTVLSRLLPTSSLLLGYLVTTRLRSYSFVFFDHADTILEEGVLSRSTFLCHFSRDHSHDRFPRDLSPDARLTIKNLISSHEPCCPSKVRLETLSRFHLMRPTHTPTSHAFG
jgi:hypothetical protein